MREVVVRWQEPEEHDPPQERLVALLAAGLERLFARRAGAVDFSAGKSVTTTCLDVEADEDRKT